MEHTEHTPDQKISVVINTFNAEKHLREVLESVKGFDEIVVCDMESTDHTLEIAKADGCKIVVFPKKNYTIVEPARTFAVQNASFHWVLVVDADELVTPELHDCLYKIIQSPDCPQGLYIPRTNRFMNIPLRGRLADYQLRFFIREGTEWPTYVHAVPKIRGRVERLDKRRFPGAMFVHLDERSVKERVEKINRYTEDEIEKRAKKNYGVAALFYRPLWRFCKSYFLDGNIVNGTVGFIDSALGGMYQFVAVSKIIEKRIKDRQVKK